MAAVLELVRTGARAETTAEKAARLAPHLDAIRVAAEVDVVRQELKESMLLAMTGAGSKVPGHVDGRPVMLAAPHAVHEALQHLSAIAVMQQVLAESECPLVRKLRIALATGYAQMNAEQIAASRRGH
jgi:hypothetical protein